MKVNKTQALLFMYELLLTKGSFTKEEVINEIEINNLTFLRYIQELRAYLFNFSNESELLYSIKDKKYLLVKEY